MMMYGPMERPNGPMLVRSDGVEVSISVNEASTTLTLQFEITGGSGGRVLGKEGSWTITVAGGAG